MVCEFHLLINIMSSYPDKIRVTTIGGASPFPTSLRVVVQSDPDGHYRTTKCYYVNHLARISLTMW